VRCIVLSTRGSVVFNVSETQNSEGFGFQIVHAIRANLNVRHCDLWLSKQEIIMFIRTKKRVIAGGIGILVGAAALGLWSVPNVLGQTANGPQVTITQLRFEGATSIAGTTGGVGQNTDAGALEFGPSLDVNTTKPKITDHASRSTPGRSWESVQSGAARPGAGGRQWICRRGRQ